MTGKLYLVATPIGNLDDITLRAIETLKLTDVVAAEDTRRTRGLLSHLGIVGKPLVACNAHASPAALAALVARLAAGESVALVTDAGTPAVSDPGADLVRAAVAAGIEIVPIPGVSAVTTAVAACGLVDGPFLFLGFPPHKGAARREALLRIARSAEPVVLFEAPHRIERTLKELAELLPERSAALCRELTKMYEEVRRGTLRELAESAAGLRGEITLVIAAADPSERAPATEPEALDASIVERLAAGDSPRSVVDALGDTPGLSRRALYRRVTELAARADEPADET